MPTSWCDNAIRLSGLVVCIAFFFRIPLQAQDQDQSVVRVDVNLVMVDATVKNKAGQIMGNLKKDDFELREDGVAQKVAIFSRDELPLTVALVLDLSDSIGPFLGLCVTPPPPPLPRSTPKMRSRCSPFPPKPSCACRSRTTRPPSPTSSIH